MGAYKSFDTFLPLRCVCICMAAVRAKTWKVLQLQLPLNFRIAPQSARSALLSPFGPRHVRCFAAGGDGGKPTGAVGWLSAKMSKQISRIGALHEVKKTADKGDVQAMTLRGVCYAMP